MSEVDASEANASEANASEAEKHDARPYLREAAVERARDILERVRTLPPPAPLTLPPGFGERTRR